MAVMAMVAMETNNNNNEDKSLYRIFTSGKIITSVTWLQLFLFLDHAHPCFHSKTCFILNKHVDEASRRRQHNQMVKKGCAIHS